MDTVKGMTPSQHLRLRMMLIACGIFAPALGHAQTLKQEVDWCKQKLGNFTSMPPSTNCFAVGTQSFTSVRGGPSRLNYYKLSENVDAVLHCEGVDEAHQQLVTDGSFVSEVLMTINDRSTGNTCFYIHFANSSTSPAIPSLDTANTMGTGAADSYWSAGPNVGQCLNCHQASGPYLMGGSAHAMQLFGLVNNGHDTNDLKYSNVHYNTVTKINTPHGDSTTCGGKCHNFTPVAGDDFQNMLLDMYNDMPAQGTMPPWASGSEYRWFNQDTPTNTTPSAGVESERFADAATNSGVAAELYSTDNPNCPAPGAGGTNVPNLLEAHVVGSDNIFVVSAPNRFALLPDRLSVFNVKDGLVCLNADQEPGTTCADYSVQYECTNSTTGVKSWTAWSNHARQSDGDHEPRPTNPCPSGSTASGIQAEFTASNGWVFAAYGPNDRLAQMSPYGIICNNSDQPDAKCSNYVVQYNGCDVSAPQANKTLTNLNTTAGAKQLTAATGSLVKGQAHNSAWTSQTWTIEPVKNTEYVRLHNIAANVYLTVTSSAQSATVGTATSNSTTNEMWLIEAVPNSTSVRLKNLFSGRYLTMADPNSVAQSLKDYLPIYSQSRNTTWDTQRWQIQ